MRTFKDPNHKAWADIGLGDVKAMWQDLEGMGISFVNGIMPPYEDKKRADRAAATAKGQATCPPSITTAEDPIAPTPRPSLTNGHVSPYASSAGRSPNKPAKPVCNGQVVASRRKDELAGKQLPEAAQVKANGQQHSATLEDDKGGKVLSETPLHTSVT